jgi:protein-tyrosine-phosphatase
MKSILFVCIENSNRSQMAEAFAKIHGKGRAVGMSAGSKPSGKINEKAISSMKELGYDLSKHSSKSVEAFRDAPFDYVVTMGCGDACPFIPAEHRIDWQIPDPRDLGKDEFRKVRDLIGEKVKQLLLEI